MSIGNAVQRGTVVYVYDENNRQIFTVSAGYSGDRGLIGYSSGTVNVQRGKIIYTYNDKGRQVGTTHA